MSASFARFPTMALFAPDVVLDALLLATSYAHVLLAPYTKVEESFNLNAIHDVYFFGADINAYDHVVHPGPVPRTFIAAAGLGAVLRPITRVLGDAGYLTCKSDVQIVARLLLATLACAPLMYLRRTVQREFGRLTSLFFALVCITQFHMMFWMSRTVPNTYAFVLGAFPHAFQDVCTNAKLQLRCLSHYSSEDHLPSALDALSVYSLLAVSSSALSSRSCLPPSPYMLFCPDAYPSEWPYLPAYMLQLRA